MSGECRKGKPCKGLDEYYLNGEANVHQKGLTLQVTTNLKTGKRTVAGVAYRKKGSDRPLFINFCPSCGTPLDSWREDILATAQD